MHNLSTLALTFREHPTVTLGRQAPPQLSTIEDKLSSLRKEVDEVRVLHFTPDMARLTAREFMQYLRDEYNVGMLLLGYDHRFGRPQAHDDYERDGRALGIEVLRAQPLAGVSSTAIRTALAEGRVEDAHRMLGRPYTIEGEVVRGYQVGRTIGFPTANIRTSLMVPRAGVYHAYAVIGSERCNAVLNIGTRPTLNNGTETSVEVHIPGYSGELYGRQLRIEILERLRDERKFESLEALRMQISADVQSIKNK